MAQSDITVIIPSLHRPDLTSACIDSFQQSAEGIQIIVVEDDADSDRNAILRPPFPANVQQVLLSGRHGYAGAVNSGLNTARSEYVLLLNNDVQVDAAFVPPLVATLTEQRETAFAACKLLAKGDAHLLDGAGDELLVAGGAYRVGHGSLDAPLFNQRRQVISGCGGATLYRRSALLAAGLFDENFFAYLEDADLGLRLLLRDMKGIYVPEATATHIGSATSGGSGNPFIFRAITQNQCLLVLKNYPLTALLRCLPRILVFQALWFWRALLRGSIFDYARGMWGAIWQVPRTLRKRWRNLGQRKITSSEFVQHLRRSEAEIYKWQQGISAAERSTLLNSYFAIFGPGRTR